MRWTRIAAASLVGGVIAILSASSAFNMPMFARKYDLGCTSCHSVIPKLTEMGMKFRAAGSRMPDEIGQEDKETSNISTQNSTRLQARYDAARTKDPAKAPGPTTSDRNQLTFHEITLYPLTGAFNKNYSSLFEVSIAAEEFAEIENAYVRGNWTAGKGHFSARAGLFHPFEGYGASDRPVSIDRPLFQTTAARTKDYSSTYFTPWNFDESGIEVGYTQDRTMLRATVFNGLTFDEEEGVAHPAQTLSGAFAKHDPRPATNAKDIQVFLTQILNPNGGGASLYWYHGAIDIPDVPSTPTQYFEDSFDRYAAYASYPMVSRLVLLGGFQQGTDKVPLADGTKPSSTSQGYFGEADVDLHECWLAGRYDWFDPTDKIDDNEITGITVAVNKPFNNGLQFISQYRHKQTKQGTIDDKKEDAFQTRLIWIW